MEPTIAQIRELLGVLVFGEEDDELEHAVVRLAEGARPNARRCRMGDRRARFAMAGGSDELEKTTFEAASSCATPTCSNPCCTSTCPPTLRPPQKPHPPWPAPCNDQRAPTSVSASRPSPTAARPCQRAATLAGIDMAGTLHVALASGDNIRTKAFPIASHPAITKTRSAKQALNMVRLSLLNRD